MSSDGDQEKPNVLVAKWGDPLIARFVTVDGRTEVHYYTSWEDAQAATTDEDVQRALALAGAWSDLDWDEVEADLYRIRYGVSPTPPIDLDELE